MLSMLLMSTGCGDNASEKEPSTGKEAAETTSVPEETDSSSEAETTAQTEPEEKTTTTESTTKESTTVPSNPENEVALLDMNKQIMHESVSSIQYAATLTEMNCATASLGENAAKRYPDLASAINSISDFYEVNLLEQNDIYAETAEEALSSGEENFETYMFDLNVHIRRADSVAVSILHDSYDYYGIDAERKSFWGENFNTETGETIYLPDVVTDIDQLAEAVEAELYKSFGADTFYSDTAIENHFKDYGADGSHWTLEYNGVTVYFGEGEIAGSDFGAINLTIEFAEYPELFNDKYTAVPEAYIVELPMKSNFYTDLDGDGNGDEISVVDSYDEENDYYATLYIYVPEVYYAESFWAYGCEPYYVKTADSKNYLYVFTELETQMYLYVYEITDTTVTKVGEVNVSPFYNNGISAILTDPNSMYFDIFSDEAGGRISEGNNIFLVGVDGMPAQG